MKKINTLLKIKETGLIAVIRGNSKENAIKTIEALIKGGVKGIEITYTTPNANEVIEYIKTQYQDDTSVLIGAGSILDITTARLAILAGSAFIVSPIFDQEIALLCNKYSVPYLPGATTLEQMQQALTYGCDIIKLFPASTLQPNVIKALKAPIPNLEIMPTGGIDLNNMEEWFNNGAICVGVGGNLLQAAMNGEYDKTTLIAQDYVKKFQSIKVK